MRGKSKERHWGQILKWLRKRGHNMDVVWANLRTRSTAGEIYYFNGADLSDAKLHRVAFTNKDFTSSILKNGSLESSVLTGSRFNFADLTGTTLSKAVLHNTSFYKAILEHANLVGAQARSADFKKASASNSNFTRADLEKADFSEAILYEANFSLVYAESISFREANLSGADLRHGVFRGANFVCATLYGADFRGADLRGAYLNNAKINKKTNFEGAILDLPLKMSNRYDRMSHKYGADTWTTGCWYGDTKETIQQIINTKTKTAALAYLYSMMPVAIEDPSKDPERIKQAIQELENSN